MTSSALTASIEKRRKEFGGNLTIVGHHYQSDAVIRHTDLRGDSLELARKVAAVDSADIVFCGVYFMGESAALLAAPGQRVHLPAPEAECSMALMAEAGTVRAVLEKLRAHGRKTIPLAYVNSTLGVKSVVGEFGGAVCTSANAGTMLTWALGRGDSVLFLPDKNLGHNTADILGLSPLERLEISIQGKGERFEPSRADKARLLLWPGFCSIHTHFTTEQVSRMRAAHPDALVVVHPESPPDVVAASDAAGSTSFIIRYVAEAPDGATIVIGTEANLVMRLAEEQKGRITVLPLSESLCAFMGETTEERLAQCLDAVAAGSDQYRVRVAEEQKQDAKASLERMLQACA